MKWRNQITYFGKYKPEPELTVNSRICSKHFLREDYIVDEEQKPGTAGNHVLAKNAVPTIFKWTDETSATLSRAIPYVKKADLQNTLNGLSVPSKSQEVQCSLEEDRLKNELQRKNMIIRQLLQRLGDVEEEKISSDAKVNKQESASASRKTDTTELLRRLSPEMPTLGQPSVPLNTHGFQIDNSSQSTTLALPLEDGNLCPTKAAPTQRVSVIKRAGSSCKNADFSKPPKKRRWSYFYGN